MAITDQAWIFIDRQHDRPLFVGPYPTEAAAARAMDSLLIDGFCQEDALDAFVMTTQAEGNVERVIPDLNDPDHTGPVTP